MRVHVGGVLQQLTDTQIRPMRAAPENPCQFQDIEACGFLLHLERKSLVKLRWSCGIEACVTLYSCWRQRQDSNLRPRGYEPRALYRCATLRHWKVTPMKEQKPEHGSRSSAPVKDYRLTRISAKTLRDAQKLALSIRRARNFRARQLAIERARVWLRGSTSRLDAFVQMLDGVAGPFPASMSLTERIQRVPLGWTAAEDNVKNAMDAPPSRVTLLYI